MEEQCEILQKLIETKRINKIFIEASSINIRIIDSFFRVNGKKNIEQIGSLFNTYTLRFWKSNKFIEFVAEQVNHGNLNLFGIDIAGIDAEIVHKLFNEAISIPSVKY